MNLINSNAQQPNILEAALSYAARGWAVIPVWWPLSGGKCACRESKCNSPGKHPIIKDWTNRGTTDPAIIRQWWAKWPKANVGIVTGEVSDILLLDVDIKEDGPGHLAALEALYDKLPDTVEVITGSGGRHILFKYPKGRTIPNKARFYPGLDTRSTGGMFVAAPSLHSSGRRYEWDALFHPDTTQLAEAPEWLISLMEKKPAARRGAPASDEPITEGARNDTLTSLAGTMRRRGMSFDAIFAALQAENLARCEPSLDDKEVETIAKSVSRYVPGAEDFINGEAAKSYNLTDMGNAQRLVDRHGQEVRFCHTWNKWLTQDGRRWIKDDTGEVMRRAKDTVRGIYGEAARTTDDEVRKALVSHARKSESESKLRAMVSLAQSEPGIPVTPDQLDANQWFLNCLNGTLDLGTGQLLPHRREDLITKIVPVNYDMTANCPTWLSFLHRIMGGSEALITFLQKAIGYSLTGSTKEQVLFILYGTGANGKSTLIEAVSGMLGDYAQQTPTSTLMVKKNDGGIPNDVARLKGSRFVSAVEAEEGQRFAESLVKQLTGGDRITARFMRSEFFEFTPEFKLFLATNHKPAIRGTDLAIWRRIRLIPFNVTIPEDQRDSHLPDKLRAELPGILRWAVTGCQMWLREGLGNPEEVKGATEGYRSEMDILSNFIEESCVLGVDYKSSIKHLYETYNNWCFHNKERALTKRAFSSRLKDRGYQSYQGTGGYYYFLGIGLVELTS